MFKRIAMLVNGILADLFTDRYSLTDLQHLRNAKQLPVNTIPEFLKVAQQPVPQKRKRKPKVVKSTTAESSRKPVKKAAQTISGQDGSQQATPARKTRQPASKQQTVKRKPVASTKVVKKATKGSTRAATPTARKSKVHGS